MIHRLFSGLISNGYACGWFSEIGQSPGCSSMEHPLLTFQSFKFSGSTWNATLSVCRHALACFCTEYSHICKYRDHQINHRATQQHWCSNASSFRLLQQAIRLLKTTQFPLSGIQTKAMINGMWRLLWSNSPYTNCKFLFEGLRRIWSSDYDIWLKTPWWGDEAKFSAKMACF